MSLLYYNQLHGGGVNPKQEGDYGSGSNLITKDQKYNKPR